MNPRHIVLLLAVAPGAQACVAWRDWRRQSRLDDEIARSRELAPAPPLVKVPGMKQAEGRPVVRLVALPGALHVDHVAFLGWVESSGSGLLHWQTHRRQSGAYTERSSACSGWRTWSVSASARATSTPGSSNSR